MDSNQAAQFRVAGDFAVPLDYLMNIDDKNEDLVENPNLKIRFLLENLSNFERNMVNLKHVPKSDMLAVHQSLFYLNQLSTEILGVCSKLLIQYRNRLNEDQKRNIQYIVDSRSRQNLRLSSACFSLQHYHIILCAYRKEFTLVDELIKLYFQNPPNAALQEMVKIEPNYAVKCESFHNDCLKVKNLASVNHLSNDALSSYMSDLQKHVPDGVKKLKEWLHRLLKTLNYYHDNCVTILNGGTPPPALKACIEHSERVINHFKRKIIKQENEREEQEKANAGKPAFHKPPNTERFVDSTPPTFTPTSTPTPTPTVASDDTFNSTFSSAADPFASTSISTATFPTSVPSPTSRIQQLSNQSHRSIIENSNKAPPPPRSRNPFASRNFATAKSTKSSNISPNIQAKNPASAINDNENNNNGNSDISPAKASRDQQVQVPRQPQQQPHQQSNFQPPGWGFLARPNSQVPAWGSFNQNSANVRRNQVESPSTTQNEKVTTYDISNEKQKGKGKDRKAQESMEPVKVERPERFAAITNARAQQQQNQQNMGNRTRSSEPSTNVQNNTSYNLASAPTPPIPSVVDTKQGIIQKRTKTTSTQTNPTPESSPVPQTPQKSFGIQVQELIPSKRNASISTQEIEQKTTGVSTVKVPKCDARVQIEPIKPDVHDMPIQTDPPLVPILPDPPVIAYKPLSNEVLQKIKQASDVTQEVLRQRGKRPRHFTFRTPGQNAELGLIPPVTLKTVTSSDLSYDELVKLALDELENDKRQKEAASSSYGSSAPMDI